MYSYAYIMYVEPVSQAASPSRATPCGGTPRGSRGEMLTITITIYITILTTIITSIVYIVTTIITIITTIITVITILTLGAEY